jgi:methanethiol S-methyltransferase
MAVERGTYVLCSSLTLMVLFWQWRPMPALIWNIQEFEMAVVIATLSLVGWVIVFTSTFLNNHFELSGLHQVANSHGENGTDHFSIVHQETEEP